MSTPRPATSRPLSAIFVGKLDSPKEPSRSLGRNNQIPSPPHTNSNSSGAGSTGYSGTFGRRNSPTTPSHPDAMPSSTSSRDKGKAPQSQTIHEHRINEEHDFDDDDDDDDPRTRADDYYGDDHTAKLSDDKRSVGTGSSGSAISRSTSASAGALNRAKSLADRNRMVLDKLAAITSATRASNRSPPRPLRSSRSATARGPSPLIPQGTSPEPTTPSQAAPYTFTSSTTSSRASFTRSRNEIDFVSGSDTEKERLSSSEDHTPPANQRRAPGIIDGKESVRRRLVSAPLVPSPPRPQASRTLTNHSQIREEEYDYPSISRGSRRTVSLAEEDASSGSSTSRLSRKNPSRRAPLPQEFFDSPSSRSEEQASSSTSSGTHSLSRTNSATSEYDAYSTPSVNLPPPTNDAGRSLRRRPSTVREPSGGGKVSLHSRWASDLSGSATERPNRYEKRGGSAESAMAAGRLVNEGLRAAGLSPRKESRSPTARKAARSSLPNSGGAIRDTFRPQSREEYVDEDVPPRTAPSFAYNGTQRFQQNLRSSRPSTSAGNYAPITPLGQQRARPLVNFATSTPLRARGPSPQDQAEDRPYSRAGSTFPQTPSTPSHPDILMDALNMLENHLSRTSSSHAPDCIRSAATLVETTRTLNARLRAATSSAIEEHIEAEVSPGVPDFDVAELWKTVGGEFRDNLKVSDELVRTLTVFLLSFGKILRENASVAGGGEMVRRPGSSGSNEDARRMALTRRSLDENPDEWGQRNVESRNSGDGRRSLDGRRGLDAQRADPPYVRSSTSMSYTRRDAPGTDPRDVRERKPGVFSGFSSRRFFTSRKSDQVTSPNEISFVSEASPSPAMRFSSMRQSSREELPLAPPSPDARPPLVLRSSQDTLLPPRAPNRNTSRRGNKGSTTSNATVRGLSIFPSGNDRSAPTTQVTTESVSSSMADEARLRAPSLTRRASSALLLGNSHNGEREQRKRTLSATSDSNGILSPTATISASGRPRASLDSIGGRWDVRGVPVASSVREPREGGRRKTIGGIFH